MARFKSPWLHISSAAGRPWQKKKLRRANDGWVPDSIVNVGSFKEISPTSIYGNVPIHRCVRKIISSVFHCCRDVNIYTCSADDVCRSFFFHFILL